MKYLIPFLVLFSLTACNLKEQVIDDIRFIERHGACWAVFRVSHAGGISLVPDRFCNPIRGLNE